MCVLPRRKQKPTETHRRREFNPRQTDVLPGLRGFLRLALALAGRWPAGPCSPATVAARDEQTRGLRDSWGQLADPAAEAHWVAREARRPTPEAACGWPCA